MFFPFHSTMMLGLESGNVIGLRMLKLACGRVASYRLQSKVGASRSVLAPISREGRPADLWRFGGAIWPNLAGLSDERS